MKITLGIKAHSGWAAIVSVGMSGNDVVIVDRRRIDLVDPKNASWAKQPYHAGERLPPAEAKKVVVHGIEAAEREAVRQMAGMIERAAIGGHEIAACGILVGSQMPKWTVDEILSVHVRMHKAEGALFPQALARAARSHSLKAVELYEKELGLNAERLLGPGIVESVGTLGRRVGPPWGKDQKSATLAALIVLSAELK